MHSVRRFVVAIVFTLLPLWACDGRGGSSGLDVHDENIAITQALDEQRCLEFHDLRICPTGSSTGTPNIETPLADATSIDCFQSVSGTPCSATLTFTARGFAPGTTFSVLSRPDASTNPWMLEADPVEISGGEAPTYEAALVLSSIQGGTPNQVQLAILAFAASPTETTQVDELSQTAATIAFVTDVLTIDLVTPTPPSTPTRRETPTATASPTPGASDCCQCPSSCAAPVDGACDDECTIMFGTTCFGELLCVLHTPTSSPVPSPTPTPCLQDNGDGTVTDGCTGLTWEKKDQAGGLHDFFAEYPWAGRCDDHPPDMPCQPNADAAAACAQATNGAAACSECDAGVSCLDPDDRTGELIAVTIWSWLAELNAGEGFAGYNDWRIPTLGEDGGIPELESTLLPVCTAGSLCVPAAFNNNCDPGRPCSTTQPCDDDEVCVQRADAPNETCQEDPGCTVTECSCTWAQYYWSATLVADRPETSAWRMETSGGSVTDSNIMSQSSSVRAVRGVMLPTATPAPTTPTPTPTPCLQDNGDGTVTDSCTGLMWEKKDQAGGLHDTRNLYTWAGACSGNSSLCQPNAAAAAACSEQTGGALGCDECASGTCIADPVGLGAETTIWDWLIELNAEGLAGYNDWRIPTVGTDGDMPQLETILATPYPCTGVGFPCVLEEFDNNCRSSTNGCTVTSCSCTQSDLYWAATTNLSQPGFASAVYFTTGGVTGGTPKTNGHYVRAVRDAF